MQQVHKSHVEAESQRLYADITRSLDLVIIACAFDHYQHTAICTGHNPGKQSLYFQSRSFLLDQGSPDVSVSETVSLAMAICSGDDMGGSMARTGFPRRISGDRYSTLLCHQPFRKSETNFSLRRWWHWWRSPQAPEGNEFRHGPCGGDGLSRARGVSQASPNTTWGICPCSAIHTTGVPSRLSAPGKMCRPQCIQVAEAGGCMTHANSPERGPKTLKTCAAR